jgi:hypothetical protein
VAGGIVVAVALSASPTGPVGPTSTATGSASSGAEAAHAVAAAQATLNEPVTPPNPKAFVYTRTLERGTSLASGSEPTPSSSPFRDEREAWFSVDGTRDGAITPSRDTEPVKVPGCPGPWVTEEDGQGGRKPCDRFPGYRSDIPSDTEAAYAFIQQDPFRPGRTFNPYDAFEYGASLVTERLVPSASLAAVLRAMSRLPGAEVVGDVTTISGKRGIAVALTRNSDGDRHELIFDSKSYRVLGTRTVTARGAGQPDVETYAAEIVQTAVVDQLLLRPDGSRRSGPIRG